MPRQKLTKRADGYFKCKYHGKQFYGKTQAEALRLRDEYMAQEKMGLDHSQDKVDFHTYALNWVKLYRNDCSAAQQKQYIGLVEFVAENLPARKMMKDITTDDIQRIVNTLSSYSNSYINKLTNTLRGIFSTAVANGMMLRNPMDGLKKVQGKKCEGHRPLEQWERELILSTYQEHDFGLAAMVMMYTGMRRGEVLYMDIDRDVDFEKKTVTVNGAISFSEGNHAIVTDGKTENAKRTIPLVKPLEIALQGRHGLICTKEDGGLMTQSAFDRKYESFIGFLETKLNGCQKRWYGKTKAHKALIAAGQGLPPWRDVNIRCHDFRVDYCTRNYIAKIPLKTLQAWMGHSDVMLILKTYTKFDEEQERLGSAQLTAFMNSDLDFLQGSETKKQERSA